MSRLPFIEERISEAIRLGASWSEDFAVEITRTASDQEYRRLIHPFPVRRARISYIKERGGLYDELLSLYRRAYGRFAGFRVKAIDDFSTNGMSGAPTAFDQPLALVSTGVYQLQKAYGTDKTAIDAGFPVRTLCKPVSGTVRVAIGAFEIRAADWVVDTTTGLVTFDEDNVKSITGVTQAANAVITVGAGHGYGVGQSVFISGVFGMLDINNRRTLILATDSTTITVAIDSRAWGAYTSGGIIHMRPQAGESVTGGCLFDIPCRFDTAIDITPVSPGFSETGEIEIVELIDP